MKKSLGTGLIVALRLSWSLVAHADGGFEHNWIIGIGGAGEMDLPGGGAHGGANVMFEWEAIEGWLEIEADVSLLAAGSGYELPVDLLFKKPFRLSRRLECMVGGGPALSYVHQGASTATHYGVEAAVDLMYWQTRRFGAWVEPAYELTFDNGTTSSLGLTAGLMVGW